MVNNSSAGAPIASLGDTATDEWGEDVHGGADGDPQGGEGENEPEPGRVGAVRDEHAPAAGTRARHCGFSEKAAPN